MTTIGANKSYKMIYLNKQNIETIGINWPECTNIIKDAVLNLGTSNFVQPIKSYLRFNDLKNRIIAMPAYIGGKFNIAGIKWIASFPDNINKHLPRASSTVIINDSQTGQVISIIQTSLLSIIRTVSVSALVIKHFLEARKLHHITIGIIGWGPIGQYHLKMCEDMFIDKISKIQIYDIKRVNKNDIKSINSDKIFITENWQDAFIDSDIVITCTVSENRYIDIKPKPGSLLLNVSLRDYKLDVFPYVKELIIVDNWEEVCRENTDIELFHNQAGLKKTDTKSIEDIVLKNAMYDPNNSTVMFNPMGMAIFDIAMAKHYLDLAIQKNIGTTLS
jgi:ornithine cyclodeaminase